MLAVVICWLAVLPFGLSSTFRRAPVSGPNPVNSEAHNALEEHELPKSLPDAKKMGYTSKQWSYPASQRQRPWATCWSKSSSDSASSWQLVKLVRCLSLHCPSGNAGSKPRLHCTGLTSNQQLPVS